MFEVLRVDAMAPGPELAQVLLSVDPTELDESQTSCWLRAVDRMEAHVEACRYTVLGHYADLHVSVDDGAARPGEERSIRPGGPGTPAVSDFAVNHLAVSTGCTAGRAEGQLGDALALRHRMPRLYARLRAGEVPGYRVRMVLRAAHGSNELAARLLDQRIAPMVDKVGPKRLQRELDKVLAEADPPEAGRRAKAAQQTRRVTVNPDAGGERKIFGYVDAFDGVAFDAALDKVADMLGDLGDTRLKDVRRAAAVGWLANPVAVLALVQRHRAWQAGTAPMPWPTTPVTTVTDDDGAEHLRPGLWPLDVPTPHDLIDPELWPRTTLVVHLDQGTWTGAAWATGAAGGGAVGVGDPAGTAELKGHGIITAAQAFERLRHSNVVIKPVIDLNDEVRWVSDNDEFAGLLREALLLANRWNPFPYADAEFSDRDDADHTIPRRLGGPTSLSNGGPLRRRLHRHKTFAKGWRVKQPFAGIFVWHSPDGRIYILDRRGLTHDLGYGNAS